MKRPALEHIIRAAADVTGEKEFVVVGSTALLAQYPNAPELMLRSNEADIFPPRSPEKSWDIEGTLGAGSQFHETFGYFADGVAPETALLPRGWRGRAHLLKNANTGGATAICPEIHDLAVAKLIAGREKDREWIVAGVKAKLIRLRLLRQRLDDVDLAAQLRRLATRRLSAWFEKRKQPQSRKK